MVDHKLRKQPLNNDGRTIEEKVQREDWAGIGCGTDTEKARYPKPDNLEIGKDKAFKYPEDVILFCDI